MAPASSYDILKHRYINQKRHTHSVEGRERKEFPFRKKLQVSYDDVFQVVSWNSYPSAQQQ